LKVSLVDESTATLKRIYKKLDDNAKATKAIKMIIDGILKKREEYKADLKRLIGFEV